MSQSSLPTSPLSTTSSSRRPGSSSGVRLEPLARQGSVTSITSSPSSSIKSPSHKRSKSRSPTSKKSRSSKSNKSKGKHRRSRSRSKSKKGRRSLSIDTLSPLSSPTSPLNTKCCKHCRKRKGEWREEEEKEPIDLFHLVPPKEEVDPVDMLAMSQIVYGLQIELSKLYEEISDRNVSWGPKLPYRVQGIGGLLFWKQEKRKRDRLARQQADEKLRGMYTASGGLLPSSTQFTETDMIIETDTPISHSSSPSPSASPEALTLDSSAFDPFATCLPTLDVPPPIQPETALSAYVLINMLRLQIRTGVTRMENEIASLKDSVQLYEKKEEILRTQLSELNLICLAQQKQIEKLQQEVEYERERANSIRPVDEYITTNAVDNQSANGLLNHLQRAIKSPASVTAALANFTPPMSPPPPLPSSLHHQPQTSLSAASLADNEVSLHQLQQPSVFTFSTVASMKHSRSGQLSHTAMRIENQLKSIHEEDPSFQLFDSPFLDFNSNLAKLKYFEATLKERDVLLLKYDSKVLELNKKYSTQDKKHQNELQNLIAKLKAEELRTQSLQKQIITSNVLLQLETIAKRERESGLLRQLHWFGSEVSRWMLDVKTWFKLEGGCMWQRKGNGRGEGKEGDGGEEKGVLTIEASVDSVPPTVQISVLPPTPIAALALSQSGSSVNNANTAAASVTLSISDLETSTNAGASSSSATDLASSSSSSKKQWLGKLLSSARSVQSEGEGGTSARHGGGAFFASLIPGAEKKIVKILLLVNNLFFVEYNQFQKKSIELSRNLLMESTTFTKEREKEKEKPTSSADSKVASDSSISSAPAESQPVPSTTAKSPVKVSDSMPSTSQLSSFITSNHPQVVVYLKILQKFFFLLYQKLSNQYKQKYLQLNIKMREIPITSESTLPSKPNPLKLEKTSSAPSLSSSPSPSTSPSPPSSPTHRAQPTASSSLNESERMPAIPSAENVDAITKLDLLLIKVQMMTAVRSVAAKYQ